MVAFCYLIAVVDHEWNYIHWRGREEVELVMNYVMQQKAEGGEIRLWDYISSTANSTDQNVIKPLRNLGSTSFSYASEAFTKIGSVAVQTISHNMYDQDTRSNIGQFATNIAKNTAVLACSEGLKTFRDNHSNEPGKASEVVTGMDQIDSLTQNIVLGNENFDPAGFRDGLCDTKAVIDEIENFMRIEEDEDPSKQRDLPVAVNDDTNETGLQDKGFGQLQRLLMDELEDVMKGNKEVVHDNVCNFATTSLDESQNGSAVGTFSNNQEAHLDLQPIFMEGCGGVGRLHIDKEHSTQNTFATIDSSLDKIVTYEVSKLSDNHEDKSSSMRNNQLEASHEMRQKEMESGKSVCTIGAVGSSDHMIEDGEMEEGEISGEFQVCGRLVDTLLKML
ncbi:hypothetical protein GH714_035944 [Hevea brasiliensis]|uniref:Uncharacterized protein n=1 Tax=Hevea brasiliensis TaxID=3981 RepID=A0A6A6KS83_HEVBR|nr:hypothetical protein GH714_035944 [Hevea brasiliensis]